MILLISLLTTSAFAQITQDDFLRTSEGTPGPQHIVNAKGEKVHLRGTNVGGWLVQESWMCPTDMDGLAAGDQISMLRKLAERFGTQVRDELIDLYEDNYWTEADFDNCAAMGMNVLRLSFTYMNLVHIDEGPNYHTLKPGAFKRFDWFIENAGKRGIYVILDMHGAFGSQNGMDHSGEINDGWQLYNNAYNREKTIWLWGEIAKRYVGNPIVAMYDLLNEPGPKAGYTNKTQWDFFDEVYKEIRKHDPGHIITIESCWGAEHLPDPSTYGWTNVVYQYHYYGWGDLIDDAAKTNKFIDSNVRNIQEANYDVPTFVGEFTFFGLLTSWDYGLGVYNQHGWSWTSWTYKAHGHSSWGLYNHSPTKARPASDTEAQIRTRWGSDIRTNNGGWVHTDVKNEVEKKLPGRAAKPIMIPGDSGVSATFNANDLVKKSLEVSANNDSNGRYIGHLIDGSFVEYLIEVPHRPRPRSRGARYTMTIQAARGENSGKHHLLIFANDKKVGEIAIRNGDNWHDFAPLSTDILLLEGIQTLRLVSTGSVNISDISIELADLVSR